MNAPAQAIEPRSTKALLALAACLTALALLVLPALAHADIDFCPPGEGAGQCALPANLSSVRGLAVNFEDGHLYVADKSNNRVEVFTEKGEFLFAFGWGVNTGAGELQTCTAASTCQKGLAGTGAGQMTPTRIAVDNDPASASHHDVYVVNEVDSRIEKFSPAGAFIWAKGSEGVGEGQFKGSIAVGVGPGGTVYVLDDLPLGGVKFKHRLQRLSPVTGEPSTTQCILFEGGRSTDMAVAPDGSLWVANELEGNGVRRYSSACAQLLVTDTDVESTALAVDEAGRAFVAQREERDEAALAPFQTVAAHAPGGALLARFGYGRAPSATPEGLAAHSGGEGGVFAAFGDKPTAVAGIRRLDYPSQLPPPGPIAAPPSLGVGGIGSTRATLSAEVNPEGKTTHVHFEYVTRAAYEAQGNKFQGPDLKSTPDVPLGTEGFRLKSTEVLIGCLDPATEAGEPDSKCLQPETEYRWRVVATNGDGAGEGTAEGTPFTTAKSLELGDIYSTGVGTDTARLSGEVNPHSIPASGYFEYVDDARFQASGFATATKAPDVDHGQAPLDFGAGETLATRSISVYPLTPGTVYHYRLIATNPLISPVASAVPGELRTFAPAEARPCDNDAARIGPGALLPDCRAYELVSPLDKEGGDIRVLKNPLGEAAVLEQSADSGEGLAYGSVRSFGGSLSAPYTSQYVARRIAGREWETHPLDPPRGRPVVSAGGQAQSEFKAFSADLCSAWVATFAEMPQAPPGFVPGYSNILRRHDRLCGAEGFEALAPLTVPQGVPSKAVFLTELLGTSKDGSHAIFTVNGKLEPLGAEEQRQLYESVDGGAPRLVCILPGGAPSGQACTAGTAEPNGLPKPLPGAISADGQRIFWSAGGAGSRPIYVRIGGTQTLAVSKAAEEAGGTSGSDFWGASSDGSTAVFSSGNLGEGTARLFRFDVGTEQTTQIASDVTGVLGMSEDAGRVYFASRKALPGSGLNSHGDEAVEGSPNLYLYEEGAGTGFVATLAGADLVAAVSDSRFGKRSSRVTPDGAEALFVSEAELTDYDNRQGGSETSCDLAKSAPGEPCREIYRYDADTRKLTCVSCNPSGARPAAPASIPFFQSPMHAARVISDDGSRAYFETAERLAARDTDGKVDVYQWERPGTGGCEEADADYSPQDEGCVELISSGQGPQDSRFVESDPTGKNVFFATVSGLLPQDYGLVDIYDARVDGGLPVPQSAPPSCEGEACQSPPAAPDDPTPASSSFQGAGNVVEAPAKAKSCKKPKVRKKGRCVKRRAHKKHGRHAKRGRGQR